MHMVCIYILKQYKSSFGIQYERSAIMVISVYIEAVEWTARGKAFVKLKRKYTALFKFMVQL